MATEPTVGGYALISQYGASWQELAQITKVTKLHFVADGRKWRRKTGRLVGEKHNPWHFHTCCPTSPEEVSRFRENVARKKLVDSVKVFHFESLSTESLQQVAAILFPKEDHDR